METSTRQWATRRMAVDVSSAAESTAAWREAVETQEMEAAWFWPNWTAPDDGKLHLMPFAHPRVAQARREELDAFGAIRREVDDVRGWWTEQWPLPIGKAAFMREYRAYRGNPNAGALAVQAALPVAGDEMALLILEVQLAGGETVDLVALAVDDGSASAQRAYLCGSLRYLAAGERLSVDAYEIVGNAGDWLRLFNGRRMNRDYNELLEAAGRVWTGAPLTRKDLAAQLTVGDSTVDKKCQRAGLRNLGGLNRELRRLRGW